MILEKIKTSVKNKTPETKNIKQIKTQKISREKDSNSKVIKEYEYYINRK